MAPGMPTFPKKTEQAKKTVRIFKKLTMISKFRQDKRFENEEKPKKCYY
jgi:hypothetical protein